MSRRSALIADIHGNHDALARVMVDIASRECHRVICLGDCVDGGDQDDAVVVALRRLNAVMVRGNHDEYCAADLTADTRSFLMGLPESVTEGGVIYTHTSPRKRQMPISNPYEAWNVFQETSFRIAFVGHTHRALMFGESSSEPATANFYVIAYGEPMLLDPADRYIVSVGPIGYTRDDINSPRYVIFDEDNLTLEHRLVDGPLLPY